MELYRSHEINCAAERSSSGKATARWLCYLSIRRVDEVLEKHYEVTVTTWTIDSARMLGLLYAREHIDAACGI